MDPTRPTRVAEAVTTAIQLTPSKDDGWTVVAGIAAVDAAGRVHVLAAASGCKCVGKLEKCDDVVRDGHAEVVARRAFRRGAV